MSVTTTKTWRNADRYLYDWDLCHFSKGWAQVDTGQDAWYYGTWAHPGQLTIINYCEGDVFTTVATTPEEFAAELRKMKDWNERQGWEFKGIDDMRRPEIRQGFINAGAADLLYPNPYTEEEASYEVSTL